MAKIVNNGDSVGIQIKWMVIVAGGIFGLFISIFMFGWHARGQTASIKAVELKTNNLHTEFVVHEKDQKMEFKEIQKELKCLNASDSVQTTLLTKIDEKINGGS